MRWLQYASGCTIPTLGDLGSASASAREIAAPSSPTCAVVPTSTECIIFCERERERERDSKVRICGSTREDKFSELIGRRLHFRVRPAAPRREASAATYPRNSLCGTRHGTTVAAAESLSPLPSAMAKSSRVALPPFPLLFLSRSLGARRASSHCIVRANSSPERSGSLRFGAHLGRARVSLSTHLSRKINSAHLLACTREIARWLRNLWPTSRRKSRS